MSDTGNNKSEVVDFLGGGWVQMQSNISACKATGNSKNNSLSVISLCTDMKLKHAAYT